MHLTLSVNMISGKPLNEFFFVNIYLLNFGFINIKHFKHMAVRKQQKHKTLKKQKQIKKIILKKLNIYIYIYKIK